MTMIDGDDGNVLLPYCLAATACAACPASAHAPAQSCVARTHRALTQLRERAVHLRSIPQPTTIMIPAAGLMLRRCMRQRVVVGTMASLNNNKKVIRSTPVTGDMVVRWSHVVADKVAFISLSYLFFTTFHLSAPPSPHHFSPSHPSSSFFILRLIVCFLE